MAKTDGSSLVELMPSEWLYCQSCGWQAGQPNTGMRPKCPECRASLWIMTFTRKDWMRHGSDLISGRMRVAELGVCLKR